MDSGALVPDAWTDPVQSESHDELQKQAAIITLKHDWSRKMI